MTNALSYSSSIELFNSEFFYLLYKVVLYLYTKISIEKISMKYEFNENTSLRLVENKRNIIPAILNSKK